MAIDVALDELKPLGLSPLASHRCYAASISVKRSPNRSPQNLFRIVENRLTTKDLREREFRTIHFMKSAQISKHLGFSSKASHRELFTELLESQHAKSRALRKGKKTNGSGVHPTLLHFCLFNAVYPPTVFVRLQKVFMPFNV